MDHADPMPVTFSSPRQVSISYLIPMPRWHPVERPVRRTYERIYNNAIKGSFNWRF
jgi:hypothetical protein